MGTKYNEIVVLVHPLFYAMHYRPGLLRHEPRNKKEFIEAMTKDKSELAGINTAIKAYSKALSLVEKHKPNALFVVINPIYFDPSPETKISLEATKFFLKPLVDMGKQKLGERFIVRDYDPDFSGNDVFLPEDVYKKLDTNLKLKFFGEYLEHCVKDWSKYVNKDLGKRDFNILESRIIKHRSLSEAIKSTRHGQVVDKKMDKAFKKQKRQQTAKWLKEVQRIKRV